ncbi:ROK family transcriptional regulator [Rugosimonospora acidiphila]|uniref:ROK family transcriptional regulator n=1 Tax=Rugosimonospora acidiphila TaxID=556531 RepID=A0ABP9RJ37_9ACTN
MRAGPSQEEIRRQNLGALLRLVHVHGAVSRAELTTALGLNRSTIGALTADLAAAGLVREELPKETGRAGRPSLVVRAESERVFVYALLIGVDRLVAARVGLGGEVLDRRERQRGRGEFVAADVVGRLAEFVNEMHQDVPEKSTCVGIGVAVAGIVRREDGLVRLGPMIGWVNEPLGAALREVLPMDAPTYVGNDADLGALAEHTRGAGSDSENIIYLSGDVGIGGGIITGGRPMAGHGGYGGEVGHMVVNPDGKPCICGARGCWMTEVGEHALLAAAAREGVGREGILAVVDAADRGDALAQAAVREVGDWLGFGVANLVNIFNPETVIFGGTLRDLYLAGAAQVRSRLNRNGLPACREHVRLRTPELGDDAPLIGAAELAFQRLLADPLDVGTGTGEPAESAV